MSIENSILDKYYYLGAQKIKAIDLLATKGITHTMSEREIATEAGVSPTTLGKWKGDPQFNKALMEYSKEISKSTMTRVLSRLSREVDSASTRDFINLARLRMQYHGELTDKSEVTIKDEKVDVDDILKGLNKFVTEKPDDYKER